VATKPFFVLPFLNLNEVPDVLREIILIAPTNNISMGFADYILKNHIDSDTDFRPELWVSESDNSPRTTNEADGNSSQY